jgi:drug/metabolite transporter (DMT)-like permease
MVSRRAKVAAAFAAVYLIWGSTYLAIRFVIESLPPFFMAGTRFAVAGLVLYTWTLLRGSSRPTSLQWRNATIISGLMLLGGHGAVVWAEQWLHSGLTSLLIATVPLCMVFLDSMQSRVKPNVRIIGALALGFSGLVLLVSNIKGSGTGNIDFLTGAVVIFGAFLWATGSLHSRSAELPSSQLSATAIQMLTGGLLLLGASIATGEWMRIGLEQVSLRSALSWIYLIVFGALIAFTSYIWLLKATTPARVSTYAYVNPIVALFLGWTLGDEPLTPVNIVAAAIILISVAIITTQRSKQKSSKETGNMNIH